MMMKTLSSALIQPQFQKARFASSARNHYSGQVVFVVTEGELVRTWLLLPSGHVLQALLTRSSAEGMGLKVGGVVSALFKAASVELLLDAQLELEVSNQWWGEVTHIAAGEARDEVTLMVAPGLEITALVNAGFCRQQRLHKGDAACAVFSASSVILLTLVWED
ncbi:TOBE domain-containing protein [Marinospirillum sp.]|uniref:TOBE domain-containing protein n=1 Tax=Marinospirillum sp. TaxID=2183934 RepID=UPI0025C23E60|nr:TOBE domain-containing protein [Marinospirillum sp.]